MSDEVLLRRIKDLEQRVGDIETLEYSKYFTAVLSHTTGDAWSTLASRDSSDDGLIDLSATFGTPANITAVWLRVDVQDSDTGNPVALVSFGSSDPPSQQLCYAGFNGEWRIYNVLVPCNADGDIYISFSETVSQFRFFVLGYII